MDVLYIPGVGLLVWRPSVGTPCRRLSPTGRFGLANLPPLPLSAGCIRGCQDEMV